MYKKKTKYKLPFTQGRNIGLSFKKKYRSIQVEIYFLLQKYKKEGKIELQEAEYKELLSKVVNLPQLTSISDEEERDLAAKKAVEYTMYKLLINGDLVVGQIEAADVLMTQKELINEAREEKQYKAALDGNAKLLEVHGLIKTHRDDGAANMAIKLSSKADGTKEAIMMGTGAECISAIRQALQVSVPKLIEEK